MLLILGCAVCLTTWLAGRAIARRALRFGGMSLLSSRATEGYLRAPRWRRLAFRVAGPLAAYVAVTILFALLVRANGLVVATTTVDVSADGPAALAGMQSGDRVVAIDGRAVWAWEDIVGRLHAAGAGQSVAFRVHRADGEHELAVQPNAAGKVQIVSRIQRVPLALGRVLTRAVTEPLSTSARMAHSAIGVITGKERVELAGPVAIVRAVSASPSRGESRFAPVLFASLAYPSALLWPLTLILELLFAPRRPRPHDETPLSGRSPAP